MNKGDNTKVSKNKKVIKHDKSRSKSKSNSKSKSKSKNQAKNNVKMVKITKKSKASKTNRLADDGYIRPEFTASELLTLDQIKHRLKNFTPVSEEDLPKLTDGDFIRYFKITEDGKVDYRPGGYLLINKSPEYLVVTSKGRNWSVQLDSNKIFVAKNFDKIQEEHDIEVATLKKSVTELQHFVLQLKKQVKQLQDALNK